MKPEDLLLHHIENGVKDGNSPISMPPNGGNPGLSEEDAADVLAYIEKAFSEPGG